MLWERCQIPDFVKKTLKDILSEPTELRDAKMTAGEIDENGNPVSGSIFREEMREINRPFLLFLRVQSSRPIHAPTLD